MTKKVSSTSRLPFLPHLRIKKIVPALAVYVAFSFYLFRPYIADFSRFDLLLPVSPVAAAMGCFLLARRWVYSFWALLLTGLIYGFGPYVLGLGRFHPIGGFAAALVPWLLLPAAYGPTGKLNWIRRLLALLPFAAIILFFEITDHIHLFVVPTQGQIELADLAGLLWPIVSFRRTASTLGFYHIPLAAVIMGLVILWSSRRLGFWLLIIIPLVAAFAGPFDWCKVSPVMWLAVPLVCLSVLAGEGLQAIASAGASEKKWILLLAAVLGACAIASLLAAIRCYKIFAGFGNDYGDLLKSEAMSYLMGAVALGIIFFAIKAGLRIRPVRWIILLSAGGVDIFLGARYLVDVIL